jgi:hypothetical protein
LVVLNENTGTDSFAWTTKIIAGRPASHDTARDGAAAEGQPPCLPQRKDPAGAETAAAAIRRAAAAAKAAQELTATAATAAETSLSATGSGTTPSATEAARATRLTVRPYSCGLCCDPGQRRRGRTGEHCLIPTGE